jgi:ribosomal protein L37AE/L43A
MSVNFNCNCCQQQFFIPQYSVVIKKDTPTMYLFKQQPVRCPRCQSVEITSIPKEELCSNIGDYSSASAENKKAMLQKRAKRAMRKDAEQRHEIETKFYGKVNEKHY